jgi:hypothetical protein
MQAIAEIIGEDAAFAMIAKLGGRDVYVPKTPIVVDHPLAKAVGITDARRICDAMAGQTLQIPTSTPMIRRRAIVAALKAGETRLEIARRLCISPRTVERIAAKKLALV